MQGMCVTRLSILFLLSCVLSSHVFGSRRQLQESSEMPVNVFYGIPGLRFLQVTAGGSTDESSQSSKHEGNSAQSAERQRCQLTRGAWCREFVRQEGVPTRPVPRGNRDCPNDCSGWGNCNHDTGFCHCPAGHGGPDCGTEVKRPCANGHRDKRFPNDTQPMSAIGPDKMDRNVTEPGWTASRCFGYCNDDVAACFCGKGPFRHIPAPPGSPPWTPPVQWGRPLADGCQPKTDAAGNPSFNHGGGTTYESVYGPDGWCNKLNSRHNCGCYLEIAEPCDFSVPMETTCVNQCGGHGECFFGFCRCHPGWYGADCSRKRADLHMEPGSHEDGSKPWVKLVTVTPPAALPVPEAPTRRRPLIYVYDMPAEYTSRMLQYRNLADACVWRRYHGGNDTGFTGFTYSIETLFHERLLQSEFRTFDPEEADFFYVPVYVACYFWPILGYADYPWWYAPNGLRPMHGINMLDEVHQWLSTQLPWWGRREGRDHIFLMAHDEGACWMPKIVYDNSIMLTHWGRTELNHTSNTAYFMDNYSGAMDAGYYVWPGTDFLDRSAGHPCYDRKKDLVIAAFKAPEHYKWSPLLGAPPLERDILLYFRGDVGLHRKPHYSRGIRQKLFNLAVANEWFKNYKIVIGASYMVPGDYSEHLARSKFCLVAPGDGWSPRAEDAILHGCVPLVVMDRVDAVFENILDWDSFSIRIREDEQALATVPELLTAVPPERLAQMQRNLARVWHRFAYASGPLLERAVQDTFAENAKLVEKEHVGPAPPDSPFQRAESFPFEDDAFHTVMQWLYHRIPETREKAAAGGGGGADAGAGVSTGSGAGKSSEGGEEAGEGEGAGQGAGEGAEGPGGGRSRGGAGARGRGGAGAKARAGWEFTWR